MSIHYAPRLLLTLVILFSFYGRNRETECRNSLAPTSCQEYSNMSTLPNPAALCFRGPRAIATSRSIFSFISCLILLCGDIESNPGPITGSNDVSLCCLNIRSISHSDHIIALHDLAESKKFDCLAVTETFLSSKTTPAEYASILPAGYEMIFANRDSKIPGAKGGGVALICRNTCEILSSNSLDFNSFEALSATVKFG